MYKYILSLLACASISASSDVVEWNAAKMMRVVTNGQKFSVIAQDGVHEVQPCFVDPKLRNKTLMCLDAMQRHGYLDITKIDNDYKITFKERGLGGGPVSGAIAYWVVKLGLWGGIVGATTATVVATGGTAAGAIVGGGIVTGGAATATAAATTVLSTGMAAGIAGTAAVVTSAGTGLTVATAATVTAATTSVGIVGSIEAASVGAAAVFTAIPFLP